MSDCAKDVNQRVRNYLNVPIGYKELAKSLGARWDPDVRRWYCPPGSDLALVFSWRKPIDD